MPARKTARSKKVTHSELDAELEEMARQFENQQPPSSDPMDEEERRLLNYSESEEEEEEEESLQSKTSKKSGTASSTRSLRKGNPAAESRPNPAGQTTDSAQSSDPQEEPAPFLVPDLVLVATLPNGKPRCQGITDYGAQCNLPADSCQHHGDPEAKARREEIKEMDRLNKRAMRKTMKKDMLAEKREAVLRKSIQVETVAAQVDTRNKKLDDAWAAYKLKMKRI